MLDMTTDPSSGSLTVAPAYIAAAVMAWWLFDAEGLNILDQLNAPAWNLSVSGVERPVFDPGAITTLASGHVAIVHVIAGTK
jgi:hypothetical protein